MYASLNVQHALFLLIKEVVHACVFYMCFLLLHAYRIDSVTVILWNTALRYLSKNTILGKSILTMWFQCSW